MLYKKGDRVWLLNSSTTGVVIDCWKSKYAKNLTLVKIDLDSAPMKVVLSAKDVVDVKRWWEFKRD